MLSFLYVYSFCAQFYSTCYEHISHCAFFGNKFWRKICQVFQRLLVHFCHIPEVHSDESECIESLKLVQNLLSQNKLLSMNTKLGPLSKILTLRHPPKIRVSPAQFQASFLFAIITKEILPPPPEVRIVSQDCQIFLTESLYKRELLKQYIITIQAAKT